jgi:outer membrane immunogenic protein
MVGKKYWLAGSALALLVAAGPAMAADLPAPAPVYKAAPPVVAPINWTGFYIGAGAGNASWNGQTSVSTPGGVPVFGTNSQGGAGWLGTVVAGYDYQIDRVVVGVLGAYDFAGVKGFYSDPATGTEGVMKETSAWVAGARVGWLIFPEFLAYASGGYSQAHFSAFGLTPTGEAIPSHTYSGWFAGVGAETTFPLLGNGWFFRSDYRFAQYNTASLSATTGGAVVDIQTIRPSVQTVSAALIYKFNATPTLPSLSSFSIMDFLRPAVPGPTRWTGFYLAGGGGYGIWHAGTSSLTPTGAPIAGDTQSGRGWFGTVNTGYDYQITSRLVAGVFGDFDFANIRGLFQDQSNGLTGTMTERNAWYAGLRGGWLITPQIMSYYDVGYTQSNFGGVNLGGVTTLGSQTYSGWFVGTGLETALPFLGNNWFGRIEYRYASYRNVNTSALLAGGAVADIISFQPRIETLRTAIVYKF